MRINLALTYIRIQFIHHIIFYEVLDMFYALLDRSNEVKAETFCSPLKNNGYNNRLIKRAPVFARLPLVGLPTL